MFHLLVYPYFSEMDLAVQAIEWAIQNRKDEVHIHFYGKPSVSFYHTWHPVLEDRLKDKKCTVDNFVITQKEFYDATGDKGILDLRRLIDNEERFMSHRTKIEQGIKVVAISKDRQPIVMDKTYYDMRMKAIQAEEERHKQRMIEHEKELRKQRTKREYGKYYISEDNGCLYFTKPVDLERFSISSLGIC